MENHPQVIARRIGQRVTLMISFGILTVFGVVACAGYGIWALVTTLPWH